MSQVRPKEEKVGEIAAKAVVHPELIFCNRQLGLVGLQLRILNGVVSLLTTEVHKKALAAYLGEQNGASGVFFTSIFGVSIGIHREVNSTR